MSRFQWPSPIPSWLDHAFRHRGLKEIPAFTSLSGISFVPA
jgi:hypothetical protein